LPSWRHAWQPGPVALQSGTSPPIDLNSHEQE
jgi:hypothetical protein